MPPKESRLWSKTGRVARSVGGDCPSLALRSIVKKREPRGRAVNRRGDIHETANRRGRIGGFTGLVLRDRTGDAPRRDRARSAQPLGGAVRQQDAAEASRTRHHRDQFLDHRYLSAEPLEG